MKIDREALDKIAHLSRLEIEEKDVEKLMQDMTNIVNWMDKLNEVDTTNVDPLLSMSHEVNALRDDTRGEHLNREAALAQAPKHDDQYFHVPKVIE